ncbi:MAG: DUF2490 domain-containing protein [Bacteroidetes bacterium]|nr:DUF2490 domain-containing protein [Bacteroidota bacterium]MBS1941921.1 DUF2490 domain-containing protein [Bacteroidota bacterium]
MRWITVWPLQGIALAAWAQEGTLYGAFPTIDHSGDLSDRWSYNAYLFDAIKLGDDGGTSTAIGNGSFYPYAEGGISYKPVKPLSLTMAYMHERQFSFQEGERIEHRIFQQLTYKLRADRYEMKFRARFDERWIHFAEGGSTTFSHRLRLLAGLKYPADARTYFTGYFEGFLTSSNDFSYDEMWSTVPGGQTGGAQCRGSRPFVHRSADARWLAWATLPPVHVGFPMWTGEMLDHLSAETKGLVPPAIPTFTPHRKWGLPDPTATVADDSCSHKLQWA